MIVKTPDLPPSPFPGGELDAETLAQIVALAEKATAPGITLCQHLKSIECDQACKCGYRGGVWAADGEHILFTMGDPVTEPYPGLEAPRIERSQEIYTAQLLVALYNYAPSLIAAAQAIDARSGQTACGLDPKGESAVAESDAPNLFRLDSPSPHLPT